MRVTRCYHGNTKLIAKCHHAAVEIAQSLVVCDLPLCNHKAVVADGLDLKVIVKLGNLLDLAFGLVINDSAHELPRLARSADDKTLSVLFKHRFRHSGHLAIVVKISERNELIQVFESHLIFNQQNLVVWRQAKRICRRAHVILQIAEAADLCRLHFFLHFKVDHRKHLGIVTRAVMIEFAEIKIFGKRLKLMVFQVGVEMARERNRIKISVFKREITVFRRRTDKADIKIGIVCDQKTLAHKLEEFGQHFPNDTRILYHIIGDARERNDLLGDRHFGVDKGIISRQNLAVFHLYRADLGDAAGAV